MAVVVCNTCHGRGEVYKEDPPGKWKWIKCPAGCKDGKVNKKLL